MAHFLEHLVFKGGEKYDDYRKVNETAERMGAVLNAYTSHDLVAFHITCRAEVVPRGDRPADRLRRPPEDRRRGARPRARRRDPGDRARERPAVGRRRAPDRPRRVRRPPARAPGARARRSTCASFTREAIVAFRSRQWAGARGGAFLVGNLDSLPDDAELAEAFGRFPSISRRTAATSRRPRSRRRRSSRSATPTSRTCGCPTARRRPARPRAARRAGRLLDAAGRLDGLAPVRRDPRAARPGLLRLLDRPLVRRRADPAAVGGPGVRQVRRGLHAHARDRRRAARRRARREDEFERARAYAAGRRVLAFENTNAVARHAAVADRRVRRRTSTRTPRSRARRDDVRATSAEVARGISEELSVACVGPHEVGEFE